MTDKTTIQERITLLEETISLILEIVEAGEPLPLQEAERLSKARAMLEKLQGAPDE